MDSPGPLNWPTQKRNFYQKISYTQKIQFFKRNKTSPWMNRFFTLRKMFLYLPEKIINFLYLLEKASFTCLKKKISEQKKFLIISGKNNFSNKKFLILVWKTIFLYSREKVKTLHFRCVLNTTLFWCVLIFYVSNT